MDTRQAANLVVQEAVGGKSEIPLNALILSVGDISREIVHLQAMQNCILEHIRGCMCRQERVIWAEELFTNLRKLGY